MIFCGSGPGPPQSQQIFGYSRKSSHQNRGMMGRPERTRQESGVKYVLWMVLLSPWAAATPCPTGQSKSGEVLIQIEQTWARSLEQRDTAALACILAEEFED